MAPELLFAAFFVSMLFHTKPVFGSVLFILTAFAYEIFSNMPFGSAAVLLSLGWLAAQKFSSVFDDSSLVSRSASLAGGLFIYVAASLAFRWWFVGGEVYAYALRSAMLFAREALFIAVFFGSIVALRFGVYYIQHAFVEEKIT
ncbi:MAG: hypothetical protein HY470_01765 [Candidatus Ryanbacteria bacterium]|nr:hypothetical protein [Candidatus Ryanbacteria bacterium]